MLCTVGYSGILLTKFMLSEVVDSAERGQGGDV